MISEFEEAFASWVGSQRAVAVSSGTAALHAAMYAAGIGPGDEVIVPTMTFAATANSVVFQGGHPVFADVCPDTLLLDPVHVKSRITPRTKAIVTVDYAGQPCAYDTFRNIAKTHGLTLIADACHALGAEYKGAKTGTLADMTVFSFHPVKHITTGEGGMVTTDDPLLAERMKIFRNHGITSDHRQRTENNTWFYEMVDLGFNYRLSDFQCALGMNQLSKLSNWLVRRRQIADRYRQAFALLRGIEPLGLSPFVRHAWHLFVVRCIADQMPRGVSLDRNALYAKLRQHGIGTNVHYTPVHLHPYYQNTFGNRAGDCPVAEAAYAQILSLPMYSALADADLERVIATVKELIAGDNHESNG